MASDNKPYNMDALDELTRRVAEALGWTNFRQYSASVHCWWALPPGVAATGAHDENIRAVPNFGRSVDACLTVMPAHLDIHIDRIYSKSKFRWLYVAFIEVEGSNWNEGYGDTRAEALANEVLAWKAGAAP